MIKEILLLQHSHYDRGYMHHPEVEDALQADYLRQVIDYCARNPEAKWTAEVSRPVIYLLDECARRGEHQTIRALSALAAQGRLGVGALATHIAPLADRRELEELAADSVRVRRELGAPVRVAFLHDINGLPWPVADVLLDAGVELLITGINEAGYGRTAVGRHQLFKWRTPQGRTLLVYNGDHYGAFNREMHPENGSLDEMLAGWQGYEKKIADQSHNTEFCYLTATLRQPCDCNPPDEEVAPLVAAWNRAKIGPPIRFVTGEDLLDHLKAHWPREIPTYEGDWTDWWNFGCATAPKHLALARRARQLLRFTETVATQGSPAQIGGAPMRVVESLTIARESLGLWNEHTFGCYKTEDSWNSVETQISCEQKNSLATRGFIWAELAARLEMERLAGNPAQSRGYRGCLIFNPTPHPATFYPQVPTEWLKPTQTHNQSWMHHTSPRLDYLLPSEMTLLSPLTIPGKQWREVSLLAAPLHDELEQDEGMIRNATREIRFDPITGRITDLVERATGRDLLPAQSDFGFADPVAETLPARAPASLPEGRLFPRKPLAATSEFVGIEHLDTTLWLVRRHVLPTGHVVKSRIGLGALTSEIAVIWDLKLADIETPNGLYAAFPTPLAAGWRAWYDTAGQRVEMDAEQLPLACRDYPTVETYAEMSDGEQRIKLHTPDVPLAMFGDFNWGKHNGHQLSREANPLLLSFVYNNYWGTNYAIAQPGSFPLRWILEMGAVASAPWSHDYLVHPICQRPPTSFPLIEPDRRI
jgi:alpha-mannosidase